jgi:GDP-L-fucose synthase
MIIRMMQAHRQGKAEFEIWGTGKPVREWGYIKDVARILAQAADLPQDAKHDLSYPVNVAQNRGYSIAESAQAIAQAIGFKGKLTFNPSYQDGAMRKVLDDRQFRQLFPNFRFADHVLAIRETVAYYATVL